MSSEYNNDKKKTLHIQDPWYTYIINGRKIVEGRLNKGFMKTIEKGDNITIFGPNKQQVDVLITNIIIYKTFAEMLETEGLDKVLPGKVTIDDGVEVYRQWYSEEKEQEFGIRAIKLELFQDAGYYKKYLKYKQKYLSLKNSL